MAEDVGSLVVKVAMENSSFQQGVQNLQRSMKVIQSEFKNATAGLADHGKGLDGLKAKADMLSKSLDEQSKIVKSYEDKLKESKVTLDETANKQVELKSKVESAEKAWKDSEQTLGKNAEETKQLQSAFSKLSNEYSQNEEKIRNNARSIDNWQIKVNNAKAKLSEMQEELSKTNKAVETQSSVWNKAAEKFNEFGTKTKSIGENLSSVGKTMTTHISAPLAGLGVAAIKVGADFEAGMSRVKAISGATGDDFKKLNDQALQLGADTAFSAKEAAEGMENLASAGFSTKEIMVAMPGMLDLAASAGGDIAQASDIAASSLRGFGLEASQSGHVADVLAKAAADTNAEISDMGVALKYAAPPAHALGISIEETAAAIGIMANAGIKGDMAGTTLRGALTKLSSPSKEAAGMMEQLGFKAFDAQGKLLPLSQVIANLQKSTKGLTDEQKANAIATIFGQETMSGMLTLMQAGPEKLDSLTKSFKNSDGAAKEMAKTMQDNLKGSIEQMKGSLETAAIKLEQILAPKIKAVADKITDLSNKFSSLSPFAQKFILIMTGIAIAIGPILLAIGNFIMAIGAISTAFGAVSGAIATAGGGMAVLSSAFTVITGPIGITIAAIVGLGAAFVELYKNNTDFKNSVNSAWNEAKNTINAAIQDIKAIISVFVQVCKNLWSQYGNDITTIFKNTFNLVASVFQTALNMLGNILKVFSGVLTGDWSKALEGLKGIFKSVWDGIGNILKSAITLYISIINTEFKAIGNIIVAILKPIENFLTSLGNSVANAAKTAGNNVLNIFKNIGTELQNVWKGISTSAVTAWNNIRDSIIAVVTPIVTSIINIFDKIKPGLQTIFNGVSNIIKGSWEGIKNIVLGSVLLILDLVTGNFSKLSSDAQGILNNLSNAISQIWQGIQQVFTGYLQAIENLSLTIWNSIVNTGMSLWNSFSSFLSSLWSSIVDTATSAWNNLSNAVISISNSISATIQSIWNGILSFFSSLPATLASLGSAMFNAMLNAISSTLSQLGGIVQSGFSSAISYISSLPSQFYSWGADMIQNLISGISSMIGNVESAVSGVASTIRSYLHFTVPDVGPLSDADTYGADFMQLLADTMTQNSDKPTEAAKKIASLVSDKIKNIKDTLAKDTKDLNNQLSNLSTQESVDLRGVKGSSKYPIEDEYNAKKKAIKDEIDLRKDQANKEIEQIQKIGKMSKEQIQQELDAKKKAVTDIDKLNDVLEKAIERKLQAEKEAATESAKIKAKEEKLTKDQLSSLLEYVNQYYEKKLDKDAIEAQAEQLITSKNQEAIVGLLKSYGNLYQDSGMTLGQRMTNGIKSFSDLIPNIVNNAMSNVQTEVKTAAVNVQNTLSNIMQNIASVGAEGVQLAGMDTSGDDIFSAWKNAGMGSTTEDEDPTQKITDKYKKTFDDIDLANAKLGKDTYSTTEELKKQQDTIDLQNKKLEAMKQEYNELVSSVGATDESAVQLEKDIASLNVEIDNNTKKLKQSQIENKYQKSFDETDEAIEKLNKSTGDFSQELENQKQIYMQNYMKLLTMKQEYKELADLLGEDSDAAVQLKKDMKDLQATMDESADKIKDDTITKIDELTSKIKEALKTKYEEQEKLEEDSINQQLSDLEKWKTESEKNINAVYDAKIKALDAQTEAESRATTDATELKNINGLQESIDYEHNSYNKEQLQKQLNKAVADRNKRIYDQEIADQKSALEQEKQNQLDNINTLYEANKADLDKKLQDVKDFYTKKLDSTKLEAEAEWVVMNDSQKDIVSLLESYSSDYENAGKTLGQKLYEGFAEKIKGITDMISSITAQINAAKDSAVQAAQSKILSGTETYTAPSYITNTARNITTNTQTVTRSITNNFAYNSPTALTPSEQNRQVNNMLTKAAFQGAI
jgi:TP901 family phage tail tape measure protein